MADTDRAPTDDEWCDFCDAFGFKPAITPAPQKPDLETRLRVRIKDRRGMDYMRDPDHISNQREDSILDELEMILDVV